MISFGSHGLAAILADKTHSYTGRLLRIAVGVTPYASPASATVFHFPSRSSSMTLSLKPILYLFWSFMSPVFLSEFEKQVTTYHNAGQTVDETRKHQQEKGKIKSPRDYFASQTYPAPAQSPHGFESWTTPELQLAHGRFNRLFPLPSHCKQVCSTLTLRMPLQLPHLFVSIPVPPQTL